MVFATKQTIKINGKSIPYYKYLMEIKIGRAMVTGEMVHHKNGNHKDNRIENLQLTNNLEHIALHVELRKNGMKSKRKRNHPWERDGFTVNDTVRIINEKSKFYNKLVIIKSLDDFEPVAWIEGIEGNKRSIPNHFTRYSKLNQLRLVHHYM